jgi:hypothetical protein
MLVFVNSANGWLGKKNRNAFYIENAGFCK